MAPVRDDEVLRRALALIKNGGARSFADAARQTGAPESTVRVHWRKAHGTGPLPGAGKGKVAPVVEQSEEAEPTPGEKQLARKLREAQERAAGLRLELREAKTEAQKQTEELEKLKTESDLVEDLRLTSRPDWMAAASDDKDHHATLVASFSDFHVGETVVPEEMAGFNAYNMDIAQKRMRRFFTRTILMSRNYLAGAKYDGIIVPSLGDTVSGNIHEELAETNETSNYDAILEVVPWIEEGLEMFADEFGKVHVISVPGNHPRDRKKPRYKRRSAHNADQFIMRDVARTFRDDERFSFDIPQALTADFQVYNTRFRAEHGDEAKGGTGIAGAMTPLALHTHRRRKQAQS